MGRGSIQTTSLFFAMKNIVIAAFALLLAYYGPQQDQPNRFDAAWMLGALALMAAVGGQLAQAARLPALVGWVGAGLLLGVSGLQIVRPDVFSPYNILLLTTGLCIGFQVGLNVVWPAQLDWRGPVLLAVATVLILLLVTVSVALLVELPWGVALLIGALASLWGPFTAVPEFDRRGALLLSILGGCFALVLLSGVLVFLESEAVVEAGASGWVARIWLSLLVGGGLGLGLRLAGLLAAPASTLVAGLLGTLLLTGVVLGEWGLMALPCGLVAGLLQGRKRLSTRRVRLLLHQSAPAAFMLFFALMGVALDLRALWPPSDGLYEVALVLVAAPLFLRGLAPMVYYPLPAPNPVPSGRIGWLLLPRGALLFELFYGPHGLKQYVGIDGLLGQAVSVDILFSVVFFSILASFLGTKVSGRERAPTAEEAAPT
jgi:hypothetical protein